MTKKNHEHEGTKIRKKPQAKPEVKYDVRDENDDCNTTCLYCQNFCYTSAKELICSL